MLDSINTLLSTPVPVWLLILVFFAVASIEERLRNFDARLSDLESVESRLDDLEARAEEEEQ